MKNKIMSLLCLTLITLMCFTSCRNIQDDIANTDTLDTNTKSESSVDNTDNTSKSNAETNNSSVSTSNGNDAKSDNETPPQKVAVSSSCFRYVSPEELETLADIIFVGKYTGQTNQITPDAQFQETQYGYSNTFVHTDYIFEPINIIKGEVSGNVSIRCEGGAVVNGTACVSTATPKFENEKVYLIYASVGNPLVPNDTEHYYIISTHCFEIDESGTVDFSGVNAEDIPKLQAQYDAAVGSVTQDK